MAACKVDAPPFGEPDNEFEALIEVGSEKSTEGGYRLPWSKLCLCDGAEMDIDIPGAYEDEGIVRYCESS
jgi:hypothetical protein